MERTEAFKTLRLDQSADGRMVENAYWTLVRQAQRRAENEQVASHEIEDLNQAYALLAPDGKRFGPMPSARGAPRAGDAFVDRFADWVAEEAVRTRLRWSKRNPEIGAIFAAMFVLMIAALAAGTSVLLTFACALAVFIAIWAPWRKVEPPRP